ncbi:biopolymer transporter ExbD [bacterium]|nr:biopolymer transporter ExbD [bacterium]
MIHLRKTKDFNAEVFTASMNDIMFFLMLFFIITSTLLNPGMIKVTLPNSDNGQSVQRREINLTMTREHLYYVDNKLVAFNEIEPILGAELKKDPGAFVMLRVDNTLEIQDLVDVLSVGNRLNVKMILATTRMRNR